MEELRLTEEKYVFRLEEEIREIKKKKDDEFAYFLALYDKKIKANKNEHNLMIVYLLGICESFNIEKSPGYVDGDYPDIDVDYIPQVRDYVKDVYTFNKYGKNRVCNIASYQTYGIKSALIDMTRVLGHDRNDILSITTKLEKMTDDDGEGLTFSGMEEDFIEIEKKLEAKKPLTKYEQLMMQLSAFRKEYPEVWDCAKKLVSSDIDWKKFGYGKPPHRKKSMGKHASGLIIAGVDLDDFVPLVVPPGSRKLGIQASAWVEGLSDTDCSSVGLIKFDYLSLEANAKIAECNRLIMKRHGLDSICALPGLANWSDTSYLNDPKCLAMANAGELKGIFQFDSPGIRKMTKRGGVTSFDDIVAYSSLYRPSAMDLGMHDEYCDRKTGKKEYEIHPVLFPVLSKTYGVMVYQETVMQVLNLVGKIPLRDCESVRKAISKKKDDVIEKYRKVFVENGIVTLNADREYLNTFFDQIVSWSGYGFNKSHATAYSVITARQLWQKVHYPLEFYASALMSLKTGDDRIPVYINDARKRNVPINQVDINKSKFDFDIVDDEIYFGFSKIKGLGDDIAEKIVSLQPYNGMQNFMEKFGTTAKVLQPLIALKSFKDKDPHTLYLYYEAFKKADKSERDRVLRYEKSINKYMEELSDLIGQDRFWEHGFDDSYFGILRTWLDDKKWIKVCKLKKKYDKCMETFANKSKTRENIGLSLDTFDYKKDVKLGKLAFKSYKSIKPILKDPTGSTAEERFYGFPWRNEFESCPNYQGFTFDDYEIDVARLEKGSALPVEVKILTADHIQSKSGKMWYWRIRVCDATDPNPRSVSVWEHDYERFKHILQEDYIVRMRLFPPEPPYPNYSLEGVKPWEMRGKNPYGDDVRWDTRVVLLSKGVKKKKFVDNDDDSYLIRKKKTELNEEDFEG